MSTRIRLNSDADMHKMLKSVHADKESSTDSDNDALDQSFHSSEDIKPKKSKTQKKQKKEKKEKKEKKSKKSKKRKRSTSSNSSIEQQEKAIAIDMLITTKRRNNGVSWAPPQKNPWTGKPFSPRFYDILEKRKTLPAWHAHDEVIGLVLKNQVIILQGETGSGKTTQVP